MNIFTRKKQPQPIIGQPEQETVKPVVPELLQICANPSCKMIGATHMIHSGDFYIGSVEWYLCDTCQAQREARRTRHNVANKSTVLETPAIPKRRKSAVLEA